MLLGEFICALSDFCISSKPRAGQTIPEQFLLVLLGVSGPWVLGSRADYGNRVSGKMNMKNTGSKPK